MITTKSIEAPYRGAQKITYDNPMTPLQEDKVNLDGLRVILINRTSKRVSMRIPCSTLKIAVGLAEIHSDRHSAFVANDGIEIAHFERGMEVEKAAKKLAEALKRKATNGTHSKKI